MNKGLWLSYLILSEPTKESRYVGKIERRKEESPLLVWVPSFPKKEVRPLREESESNSEEGQRIWESKVSKRLKVRLFMSKEFAKRSLNSWLACLKQMIWDPFCLSNLAISFRVRSPESAGFIRSPQDLSVGPSIWKEVGLSIWK